MSSIIYFVSKRGENYVREFLLALPKKVAAKLVQQIKYLSIQGPMARFPYVRFLRDGIYELRGTFARLEPRIFYFFCGDKIVLTHGILKKTRTVPPEEIDRAKAIRSEYLN